MEIRALGENIIEDYGSRFTKGILKRKMKSVCG
jgi:hypothetical protein